MINGHMQPRCGRARKRSGPKNAVPHSVYVFSMSDGYDQYQHLVVMDFAYDPITPLSLFDAAHLLHLVQRIGDRVGEVFGFCFLIFL